MTTAATRETTAERTAVTAECEGGYTWPEFVEEMGEKLNDKRSIIIASSPDVAKSTCCRVDYVCAKFTPADGDKDDTPLSALQHAPRATFTTAGNIEKAQKCTSVYGRVPMLVVLDMEEDHFFVLDLNSSATTEAEIEAFLRGVVRGNEPKALQGAAPPADDRFEPTHGITLTHGLCAVTCSIARLKRQRPGGAICAFWSGRCVMCPAILMLLDRVVGLVWEAAARHGAGPLFTYMACNVDDNDLPEQDWPDPHRQLVPSLVAYTADGKRIVYSGRRTAPLLVSFLCDNCFPSGLESAAQIRSDAVTRAEQLQEGNPCSGTAAVSAATPANEAPDRSKDEKAKRNGDSSDRAEETGRKRPRCYGGDQ
ncbi:hypothetical protein DQ04_00461040 [Trypanosoma grayi]|uniref:hypothetical protein n=1 Tax=Trypanosoma grayi TaxID=71804 RepID=UPI0004F44FB1|nr:hypothetical protein DQ04_00461040 [Trypanosoma grayi]KEG14450.1 hypothetical protein DQ04_00461040 [Trypanosoma grayi]